MMVLDIHIVMVVLVYVFLAYVLKFLGREYLEQVPGLIQAAEYRSNVIRALTDKLAFELLQKLKVQKIILVKGLFSYYGLHGQSVLSHGVVKVKLVGDFLVVCSCSLLSNGAFHKTTQRWQNIDRRINVSVMKLSVQVDLTLCDIPRKVRDGMSDIIIGHRQYWELCDRSVLALHSSSSFVNGREVGIHVPWIRSSSRHLFSGR